MHEYAKLFPKDLMDRISDMIESRLVTAGELKNRKHQIMDHYKIGTSAEISSYLIGCLLTLSDQEKQQMIDLLRSLQSKQD